MRLIDADALDKIMGEAYLSLFNEYGSFDAYAMGYESAVCAVEAAPTIDAVEVVRCKDCKHYENHRLKVFENCVRNERYIPMKPDDFCSYGERRNNE